MPALGALAVEPLYLLVETSVVGRLGTSELAGVAVAGSLLALVIAASNFITYGTTERVARRLGADRPAAAAEVGVQAIWLAGAVAAIATPLLWLLAGPLTSGLGARGATHQHAVTYLQISAWGIPFLLLALAAQGTLRGSADFRTPFRILAVSTVSSVVLLAVFVPLSGLGVAGAAWAALLAQVGAGVAFMIAVRPRFRRARTRRTSWHEMSPLLTAGRHLLLRVGSMLAVFTGSTAVAARLGDDTLAAHQVTMTMLTFLALLLDAVSVPAQTLVADELGAGESAASTTTPGEPAASTTAPGELGAGMPVAGNVRAALIASRVTRLSLRAGVVLGLGIVAVSPVLPRVFSNDPDVRDQATIGLALMAVVLIVGAVAYAGDGVLIGAGDYRFLGRASFGYLLAVAPIAVLVLSFPSLGIAGIWIGLAAWMTLRAAITTWRVRAVVTGNRTVS